MPVAGPTPAGWDAPRRRRANAGWALLIVLGAVLAYLPVREAGFIWDDDLHVTANPVVVGPHGLKEIWTSPAANYFPLTMTSFRALHALFGLDPLPYHVATLALHIVAGLLLWRVLERLRIPGSPVGAMLWVLHPVQVESVAWISELKNTQSAVFFLLGMWFFIPWLDRGAQRPTREYGAALLCAALAILSKSSTVMLPVVLLLCAWWRGMPWRWAWLRWLVPFFMLSAFAAGWTIWEQKYSSGAQGAEWGHGLRERLAIAGHVPWFYLGKLLWPEPLVFIYERWEPARLSLLPLAIAAGIGLFLGWRQRREGWARAAAFAFGYFLALLFPVLGLFDVYFFRYAFVGDHLQYLASMGPLALLGAAGARGLQCYRAAGIAVAVVTGGALIAISARHAATYRSDTTLWETTVAANPKAWMARNNLGERLVREGRPAEARPHLEAAIRLKPDHAEAHYNLGNCLRALGELRMAAEQYRTTLRLTADAPNAHTNLGGVLLMLGDAAGAIEHYSAAARLQSGSALAQYNLGHALHRAGRLPEAQQHYRRALELDATLASAHADLATLLGELGRAADAVRHYEAALAARADFPEARFNYAGTLLGLGQVDAAVAQYEAALRSRPEFPEAHYALGVVAARKGERERALTHLRTALQLRPGWREPQAELERLMNPGDAAGRANRPR